MANHSRPITWARADRDELERLQRSPSAPAGVSRRARAVLLAARSGRTGQVWVVQPGRVTEPFRFPNVPGARHAGGASAGV